MATDHGLDLGGVEDCDENMTEVNGRLCLAEALARRVTTRRGSLIDDPDYGTDVTAYLNDDLDIADIARIGSEVDAEFRKDERVIDSKTTVSLLAGVLTISSTVTDGAGPFALALAVTDVSTTILKVG